MSAPTTETLLWCATRNGYADPTCGTGHTHYEVEVDEATGKVLTPASEQYARQLTASYFVAPDADGLVWVWAGQPGDAYPQPVIQQHQFTGHLLLWQQLTRLLPVSE